VATTVKALHVMGGAFPSSADIIRNPLTDGAEWNFWALDTPHVTARTVDRLTALGVVMTFVGYEVGKPVPVGREVVGRLGRDHPTSDSYYQYVFSSRNGTELTSDNPAFDEVALFHLVEGETGDWFGEVTGRPLISSTGVNTWDPDGPHRYVTLREGVESELIRSMSDRITGRYPS
jgi:inosine-uridine nucleoside N-ribohydrolase